MGWFKRIKEGISTRKPKAMPKGVWTQCEDCKERLTAKDMKDNAYCCPHCDHNNRVGSKEYFEVLFDNGYYKELFGKMESKDFLGFTDLKPYDKRLRDAQAKTGLKEAITVGKGKINGFKIVIAAMDFKFIGGSMGSVVGEKISKAIDYCIRYRTPFMIVSKSGGARMMESAFSLMQMAKTSAKLSLLAKAGVPFISLLTHPTTGGVTASFAMLGDINIAEPNALIGFAGPRIIKETIKQDLPPGFQTSEFLLDHGFVDFIVDRRKLKKRLTELLDMFGFK